MTASERLERMERCGNCVNGECLLGDYPPYDCGFCDDFVDAIENDDKETTFSSARNVKIYVPANELWAFYAQNAERCTKEMILIAENTETEYAVYITDNSGALMLSVCKGEKKPEYEEFAVNSYDCETTAKKLFSRYLFPITIVDDAIMEEKGSSSTQEMEDEMYEREDELYMALQDFLAVALREDNEGYMVEDFYGREMVEEILNHILEYLSDVQCLEIYRPMFIVDEETGEEIYTEFPYEKPKGVDDTN